MLSPGELVLLISPKGKRYLRKLDPEATLHTHDGTLAMADVAAGYWGDMIPTHMGKKYLVLRPTVHDLIKGVKRNTQIMYPKEIGYLLLKMGIGPGTRVIESGTGSGGLTTALAYYVGDTGKVYTYERREDFYRLAGKNLAWAGLSNRVEQVNRNIEDGFIHEGADALFLDVRTPWDYLHHIPKAVIPGAMCGFLLPTTNQVSSLLRGLEQGPFADMEVLEILVRRYKPVWERLRPEDRMVAHTGFLIFARCQGPEKVVPVEDETEETPVEAETPVAEEPAQEETAQDVVEQAEAPQEQAEDKAE